MLGHGHFVGSHSTMANTLNEKKNKTQNDTLSTARDDRRGSIQTAVEHLVFALSYIAWSGKIIRISMLVQIY